MIERKSPKKTRHPITTGINERPLEKNPQVSRLEFIALSVNLICFFAFIYALFINFPDMEEDKRALLKLPRDIDQVKQVYGVLKWFVSENYSIVLLSYIATFLSLQSFAIPGSIPLAILGGSLFGGKLGSIVSTFCTGIGATHCYFISRVFGQHLVQRFLKDRLLWWKEQMGKESSNLFQYIFILRLTPIFPGWFLNIASPHIGIPSLPFFFGTLCGIFPTTFIYSFAGETLSTFGTSGNDDELEIFTTRNILILVGIGIVVLAPRFVKSSNHEQQQNEKSR